MQEESVWTGTNETSSVASNLFREFQVTCVTRDLTNLID